MNFKPVKVITFLLSITLLIGNLVNSNVNQIDINKIKQHKKTIQFSIRKEKLLRYVAAAAVIGVASWMLFGSNMKKEAVSLDPRNFDDKKLDKLNNLLKNFDEGRIIISANQNNGVFDYLKNKARKMGSFVGQMWSAVPMVISQYYAIPGINWFFFKHDIRWVVREYNIGQLLSDLKLNAVMLDPGSPILNIDTASIQRNNNNEENLAEFVNLDELIKLKIHACIVRNNKDKKQTYTELQKMEELSNKFVDEISKVIAYLFYREEESILKNNAYDDRSKKLSGYASELIALTNTFSNDMNSALSEYHSNSADSKNILTSVYRFNNLFGQLIARVLESNI